MGTWYGVWGMGMGTWFEVGVWMLGKVKGSIWGW